MDRASKEPRQRPPTINDVARLARVAVGTVSNVLNSEVPVSPERRARVMDAIARLGYAPNMLAHGLRRQRSHVVGVCVPRTSVAYLAALVDAFEEIASDSGYQVMQVLTHQDPETERERVQALLSYRLGGLILVPGTWPDATFDLLAASGTPVVVVDRPTDRHPFDQVTFDNRAAMQEATARLIGLGHRRILFLVRQRQLVITRQRVAGMRAALRASGTGATATVLECPDEAEFAARLAPALAAAPGPTALIVSNSAFAAGALRAIRALGLRYPEDLSLLAFDEPEWAELVSPTLSVVRQPTREIARIAWELLLRRMRAQGEGPQRVQLQAQLVLRQSVVPHPVAAESKTRRPGKTGS